MSRLQSSIEGRFLKKNAGLVKSLLKETHFSKHEIESIFILYHKLVEPNEDECKFLTTEQLIYFLHNTMDMTDQLKQLHITIKYITRGHITMKNFTRFLSIILKGTIEEKAKYCYEIYNYPKRSTLRASNMYQHLADCFPGSTEISEESVQDLCDTIFQKLDVDKDREISFNDYRTTVLRNPMMLEAFGPCLPTSTAIKTFFSVFVPPVTSVKTRTPMHKVKQQ